MLTYDCKKPATILIMKSLKAKHILGNNKIHITEIILGSLLGLLWLVYLFARAIKTGLINDEVFTYFFYVQSGEFLPFASHTASNNHFLNSALCWVSSWFLGPSSFSLRLPNLLSGLLYLVFVFRTGLMIRDNLLRWLFILCMLLAHSFTEFFSLARGYGMSMAFLIASVYYLMKSLQQGSNKSYAITLLMISLGVSANLTLIPTALLINGLIILNVFLLPKESISGYIGKGLIILATGIIPLVFFSYLSFYFKDNGLLIHGTTVGFWPVTALSMLELIFGKPYQAAVILIIFLISISILILILYLIKNHTVKILKDYRLAFPILHIGNIIAAILMAKVLQVNYPEDRTGMYFYPLFIGTVFFLASWLKETYNVKRIGLLYLPLLIIPLHFVFSINFNIIRNHIYSSMPERFFEKIYDDHQHDKYPPTISGHGLQSACWSWMNYKNNGEMNQMQVKAFPEVRTDYIITQAHLHTDLLKDYEITDYEPGLYLCLLKRRFEYHKKFLFGNENVHTVGLNKNKSFLIIDKSTDSLSNQNIFIEAELGLFSIYHPLNAILGIEIRDNKNKVTYLETFKINQFRDIWDGTKRNLKFSYTLKTHENDHRLKVYLFNKEMLPFGVSDGKIKVYKAIKEE